MSSFYLCSNAVFDIDLSNTAFKVYSFLARSANNVTRDSFYSRSNIAKLCKVSESTVIRACRELCKNGLLEIRQRFLEKGRQTSNLYILLDNQQTRFDQSDSRKEDVSYEASPVRDKGVSQNDLQAKVRLFSCASSTFQKDLTPNQLKVYSYLSARAGKDRRCYPPYKEIAKDCRISVSTVYRCVKKLCEYDFIKVIPQNRMETCGNQGRSVNLYLLKEVNTDGSDHNKTGGNVFEAEAVPEEKIKSAGKTANRSCRALHAFFTPFLTPSPKSPMTPQITKSRNNLKQRKKRVFSQVTKWYKPYEDKKFVLSLRNKPP